MKVVGNTSPIINLAGVDSLDLLFKLYGNLIIPSAVFYEIAGSPYKPMEVLKINGLSKVKVGLHLWSAIRIMAPHWSAIRIIAPPPFAIILIALQREQWDSSKFKGISR